MSNRSFLCLFSSRNFYPDRVRSWLQFLRAFGGPFEFGGLPSNLYTASEKLVSQSGPLEPAPYIKTAEGYEYPVKLEITRQGELNLLFLDLGEIDKSARLFMSPQSMDLFRAAARMTAADCAMLSFEPSPNLFVQLTLENNEVRFNVPPVALWLSAPVADRLPAESALFVRHTDPDGGVLLLHPSIVDSHDVRQAIRWIVHDRPLVTESVSNAVRQALVNPDWEVRVSAVLCAARLRIRSLAVDVRHTPLPETSREGLSAEERRTVRALHRASLMLLSGEAAPAQEQEDAGTRDGMRAHLLRCADGFPVSFADDLFLLTYALTTPVPLQFPELDAVPEGIIRTGTGTYRTAKSGIEFLWVPPVPHWLGAGPNIRNISPSQGFLIAKWPVEAAESGEYLHGSWEEAGRVCRDLSISERVAFRLPSSDEWEMAVRGPDARLYPWGNGFEPNMLARSSPWGLHDCTGVIGQWTQDGWICGLENDLRCSARNAQGVVAAVRLAITPCSG